MERFALFITVFGLTFLKLSNAAGAYHAIQPNGNNQEQRASELDTVQREMAHINEAHYAANLETILQLLAERDAQEREWRRQEAADRENMLAELSAQKRDFHYYGSRGKKSFFEQQKRFNYMPSRG